MKALRGPAGQLRRPTFVQSIRFRLTVMYSTLLFAAAALVLFGTYFALERSTNPHPITKQYQASVFKTKPTGEKKLVDTIPVADVREIESEVNFRTLQTLCESSAWALSGLFALSLGIGWVLSGRALRPVRAITRTAEEIQATELSRRIELGGPRDELHDLAETLDSMLARLEDAFHAQRQLIDDASHELRNPLAIIRANVDAVLTQPDATADEREQSVAVISRATERMTGLVEDLLATSRRAAPAFAEGDLDLAAVTREASEEFTQLAAERQIHLRSLVPDPVPLVGDRDALRRAVVNLLSNGVRLAPRHSTITVSAGGERGWRFVAVADEGPARPPRLPTRRSCWNTACSR